jgi:hypothetical protein
MMPEEQAIEELPAGPPEGGGGYRPWPPRPGVAELPVGPTYAFSREAASELFRLRDRVHALESQLLAVKLSGGVLNFPQPWRIAEFPLPDQYYSTGFHGGELRGPEYPVTQLTALLQALLNALQPPNVNPGENPAEIPR